MQTVCNDSDFFKRRIIQRIAARELIESLQKKVRKGQVSGTSSLGVCLRATYAYAINQGLPAFKCSMYVLQYLCKYSKACDVLGPK